MKTNTKTVGLTVLFVTGLMIIPLETGFSATAAVQDCCCGDVHCEGGCQIAQHHRGCRKCGGKKACHRCPQCQTACCTLEIKTGEEKRTCYVSEQKVVCIPRVQFPWQKCCPPGLSRTRSVNVLKTKSYTCPTCEYVWSVREIECDPVQDLYHESETPSLQPNTDIEPFEPVVAPLENDYQVPDPKNEPVDFVSRTR